MSLVTHDPNAYSPDFSRYQETYYHPSTNSVSSPINIGKGKGDSRGDSRDFDSSRPTSIVMATSSKKQLQNPSSQPMQEMIDQADPLEKPLLIHNLYKQTFSSDVLYERDKRRCYLAIAKVLAALIATTPINLAIIMPRFKPLTWVGILLGNAIAFPPEKITFKKVSIITASVFAGGLCSFLPEYYFQDSNPVFGELLASTVFLVFINVIWRQALEGLKHNANSKAFLGSIIALGSYKLAHHSVNSQPLADFLGSAGIILGNMTAFPPTGSSLGQIAKLIGSLIPVSLAGLANAFSGNDKFNQAATFLGGTSSLALTWYWGNKGLIEQRLRSKATISSGLI